MPEVRPKQRLALPVDDGYFAVVQDIWENEQVQSMRQYPQHGVTSCLQHSLNVSYLSYRFCLAHGLDARAAARAGLLHDLFLYDWHAHRREKGERLHGFTHPGKALENARRLFSLTPKESDIILRHMWPLTLTPPNSREAYVVVLVDKYTSLLETFRCEVLPDSAEPKAVGQRQKADTAWRKLWGIFGQRV